MSTVELIKIPEVRVNYATGKLLFYLDLTSPVVINLNELRATVRSPANYVFLSVFTTNDKEYEYKVPEPLAKSIISNFDTFITTSK